MNSWSDFFVAELGAAAALAGLLFVAVSINLTRILAFPHLPTRAVEALTALLSVLAVATFGLVPDQDAGTLGFEVGAVGALTLTIQLFALATTGKISAKHGGFALHMLFNTAPALSFMTAGALLNAGDPSGLYWIVAGVLLSFIAGIIGAWVLLIEIHR